MMTSSKQPSRPFVYLLALSILVLSLGTGFTLQTATASEIPHDCLNFDHLTKQTDNKQNCDAGLCNLDSCHCSITHASLPGSLAPHSVTEDQATATIYQHRIPNQLTSPLYRPPIT